MPSSLVSGNASASISTSLSHYENNLEFSVVGAFVHDKAILGLHEIYEHVHNGGSSLKNQDGEPQDSNKPTIAQIKGVAGTGKFTVAKRFMDQLEQNSKATDCPVKP